MVHYKLHYFPARARAEPQRLIFAAAGVAYEDIRHGHDGEAWESFKPQTQTGKIPMLEIFDDNGNLLFKMSQSVSIGKIKKNFFQFFIKIINFSYVYRSLPCK